MRVGACIAGSCGLSSSILFLFFPFFFGRVIIYFFDTYTDGAESSVRARGKARVQQEMEEEEVHQAE